VQVDLAHEQGNPRQLQLLADALGVPEPAEAARLLTRLRRWATEDHSDGNGMREDGAPDDRLHHDSRPPSHGRLDNRLRPRALAQAAGWRGDPSALVAALAQARWPGAAHRGRPRATGPAPVLWRAALAELAALVNRANYDAFLADTAGLYREGDWLTVGVPSAYALTALADRFRSTMAWAVYVVSGERLQVRLIHAPPAGPLLHLAPPDDSSPRAPIPAVAPVSDSQSPPD
jgi:hypothetical protein